MPRPALEDGPEARVRVKRDLAQRSVARKPFNGRVHVGNAHRERRKVHGSASAELLGETHERTGALVVGRRLFDLARGWGGRHPMMDLPVFVVTHSVSREWVYEGSPSTFVTDGVEEAAERARAVVADNKDVGVGGANVA